MNKLKKHRRLLHPGLEAARGEPHHRTLRAAAPGISQTGASGTVQLPYFDRDRTYLADLNEQAEERLDLIIEQMKAAEGVTEELKALNQLKAG